MPAGNASIDGQVHDLYAQAQATRKQAQLLVQELHAARRRTSENWQLIQDARDKTARIRAQWQVARSDPGRLRCSAYARLHARLATMPMIEQAKGMIMAQTGWSEDQAFDALRRVSQRENIKVRELAARIVAGATQPAPAQRRASPASAAAQLDGEPVLRMGAGNSRDRYRASA